MTRESQGAAGASAEGTPLIEGKYAILAVLVLGLVGAAGGWWYRGQLQRNAITFLGADNATLIQEAPSVVLWELEPADASGPSGEEQALAVANREFIITNRVQTGRAPGLIHLRQSLINDRSYDWESSTAGCEPQWKYALRFDDEARRAVTVLLDFSCYQLLVLENQRMVSMKPMAAGLEKFIAAQLAKPAESHATESSR
jgi:hypothetical protein